MIHHPVNMLQKSSGLRKYGDLLHNSLMVGGEAQKPQILSTTRYVSVSAQFNGLFKTFILLIQTLLTLNFLSYNLMISRFTNHTIQERQDYSFHCKHKY